MGGEKAFLRVPEVLERQTDDAEQPDLLMSELTEVFFCPRAYIPGAPERRAQARPAFLPPVPPKTLRCPPSYLGKEANCFCAARAVFGLVMASPTALFSV